MSNFYRITFRASLNDDPFENVEVNQFKAFYLMPGTDKGVHEGSQRILKAEVGSMYVDIILTVWEGSLAAALSWARRDLRVDAEVISWSGWYSQDVVHYAERRINEILDAHTPNQHPRYTADEIANPDSILTNVPEGSTNQVINLARRRHKSLVRYKMAIQFARANPDVEFSNDGQPHLVAYPSGITRLRTRIGNIRISFSAVRNQMHVTHGQYDEFDIDEWIVPTDSHRFRQLMQHAQHLEDHPPVHPPIQGS